MIRPCADFSAQGRFLLEVIRLQPIIEIKNLSKSFGSKQVLKDLNLKFRGSSNQRVINLKETLKQNKIVLYL